MRTCVFWAGVAGLIALRALAGEVSTVDKVEPRKLRINQHGCAALLREDFKNDAWGPQWGTWIQDEALRVYCKDGQLRVTGTSGKPVEVCADHHEFRFTGLVSKNSVQRDVVLACVMQVLAPLPKGITRARYVVHLCGATPDYFLDAALCHEPDGRDGWFFNPIAADYPVSHDFAGPFLSIEQIAADKPHTVVIDYNSVAKVSRGFVVDGDTWHSLGERKVYLSTTQAELKVDVPYNGVKVDVAFSDVRMYLRPDTAPARFVVVKEPFPYFPFAGVTLELVDPAGKTIGQATTDAYGEAVFLLPTDRLYPIGALVRAVYQGKQVGIATIRGGGINGLYPGDVWIITAPDDYKYEGKTYPLGY